MQFPAIPNTRMRLAVFIAFRCVRYSDSRPLQMQRTGHPGGS